MSLVQFGQKQTLRFRPSERPLTHWNRPTTTKELRDSEAFLTCLPLYGLQRLKHKHLLEHLLQPRMASLTKLQNKVSLRSQESRSDQASLALGSWYRDYHIATPLKTGLSTYGIRFSHGKSYLLFCWSATQRLLALKKSPTGEWRFPAALPGSAVAPEVWPIIFAATSPAESAAKFSHSSTLLFAVSATKSVFPPRKTAWGRFKVSLEGCGLPRFGRVSVLEMLDWPSTLSGAAPVGMS